MCILAAKMAKLEDEISKNLKLYGAENTILNYGTEKVDGTIKLYNRFYVRIVLRDFSATLFRIEGNNCIFYEETTKMKTKEFVEFFNSIKNINFKD